MELSNNLLKEFAAITNDKEKPNESTTYGIVSIQDDQVYVTFDGASTPTPVDTLVDVQNGDRVMVRIKNHVATITGISTPAAKRISSLSCYGEAINPNIRSPEEDTQSGEPAGLGYEISDIDSTGGPTSFKVYDYYKYLEPLFVEDRVIYFYDQTDLIETSVGDAEYDDETFYWTVTANNFLEDLTTNYELYFSVWTFRITTSIDTGKLTVDGEHNSRWVDENGNPIDPEHDTNEDKHTRYVELGPETADVYDPVNASDDYFDTEGTPPQTITAIDPETEPIGYAPLCLTGDRFHGFGASTIYDEDTETITFQERDSYLTPSIKVTPFGIEFGVDASPVEEDPESDHDVIDHPAYNTLKINAGFKDVEDAIVFTKHVEHKATWNWNTQDKPTYTREYFEDPNELYKGKEYRPAWQYVPGDRTKKTGTGDTYKIVCPGYVTDSKASVYFTVPLDRPVSSKVKTVTLVSASCKIRQNGSYILGDSSTTVNIATSTFAKVIHYSTHGLTVRLRRQNGNAINSSATNNGDVMVDLLGLQFEFA